MDSKEIKCPYYQMHTTTVIVCEGISGQTRIVVRALATLPAAEQAEKVREIRKRFCSRDWQVCPIAAGLNIKYELED